MKQTELSTRDRLSSVTGAKASLYVNREIPSALIPFRGDFPLLNETESRRFRKTICSTMWIEELSPKFLYAAVNGGRMSDLEAKFSEYLRECGLSKDAFEELESVEKSSYLKDWMRADSVCDKDFIVRPYRAERRGIYFDIVARRAYWDDLCFEFERISWEKKLLSLALYVYYGGNLKYVVERYKAYHPDYSDRVPFVLVEYISFLRTGEAVSVLNSFFLDTVMLSESRLMDLLIAELRERLREDNDLNTEDDWRSHWTIDIDSDGEEKMREKAVPLGIEKGREYLIFGNLTNKPFTMETKESLLRDNPWRPVAEALKEKDYANPLENNSCPAERDKIAEINRSPKNAWHKLHIEVVPEPVLGDFFNAKIAILTLNPGWVETTEFVKGNISQFDALSDEAKRKFVLSKAKALSLNGDPYPTTDEEINSVDTWYWNDRLREVMELTPNAVNHITIIEYLGYHSEKYRDFPKRIMKSEQLPSQSFAVRLVQYLMDKNAVIVIARSEKRWYEAVEGLKNYPNLVLLKNYRQTYISRGNCKGDGFERIRKILTE